jgi:thioredoxin-related protein
MKKLFLFIIAIVLFCANSINAQVKVQWTNIEQAQEIAKTKEGKDKLIFVDCYTDWCGWCKVMDNKTFSDETIATLMNYYFINVKFNAEQKEDITFNENVYKYQSSRGKGSHQLAGILLQNKLAFPSFAILNGNDLSSKTILQGYIEKNEFEPVIVYLGEGFDTKEDFDTFKARYEKEIRSTILKKIKKK